LGDISYGVYLWHWPLIVMVPYVLGTPLGTLSKLIIIGATVLFAGVSKVLIEDPFRYRRFWRSTRARSFYPAIAGMLAVCLTAGVSLVILDRTTADARQLAAERPPAVLGTVTDPDAPLQPLIADRLWDRGAMYDCFDLDHEKSHVCGYGTEGADVNVAIAGDSHSAHFIPALIAMADSEGWHLDTFVGVSCDAGLSDDCGGSDSAFAGLVAGDYDAVFFSAFRGSISPVAGVEEYMAALHSAGVNLIPVSDVPLNPAEAHNCIDNSGGDPTVAAKCTTSRDIAVDSVPDRIGPIADALGIAYLDLTSAFCNAIVCHALDGNTIIYQDSPTSHLTATFGRQLAPRFTEAVNQALTAG
ncbi:MAG: acyltransferase, partial [Ramlibacter sp.]|nr:acyltransferase [Cryobacterium sp.]